MVQERCVAFSMFFLQLQALILEAEERDGGPEKIAATCHFYEVTIASVDQPKLLSRLSEALVS